MERSIGHTTANWAATSRSRSCRSSERLARFKREAKLLAALNHPNIAVIHGLEESGAMHYLVLELVPGETRAARLSKGRLSVTEALEIALH